jgi:ParB-like chromosome segregation protein Spo0J
VICRASPRPQFNWADPGGVGGCVPAAADRGDAWRTFLRAQADRAAGVRCQGDARHMPAVDIMLGLWDRTSWESWIGMSSEGGLAADSLGGILTTHCDTDSPTTARRLGVTTTTINRYIELDRSPVSVVRINRLKAADPLRVAGENTAHVRLLAESEVDFPPILVHRRTMRVIDGMHRLRAAVLRGKDEISVEFFDGSDQEAFVLGLHMNITHGLPLSLADRKAAAARLLRHRSHWSDRGIAAATGLSHKTVSAVRRRLAGEITQSDTRVGRDGHVRPTNTAERRRLAGELLVGNPDASLREVARAARISPETVRDVRARVEQGHDPVLPAQRSAKPDGQSHGVVDHPTLTPQPTPGLGNLRNDPTLRFTEAGRALLRLLALHTISPTDWSALVESVPTYCRDAVVGIANECAKSWLQFADQLK